MTKHAQIFAGGLLAFLAALAAGCGHDGEPKAAAKDAPLPAVQTAAVTRGTLEKTLPATGILQVLPGQEASVTAPAAGVLSALLVRYGQTVAKGQAVAQLSTAPLAGQIQSAAAAVGQNRVQVSQAQAGAVQQEAQSRTAVLSAAAALKNAEAAQAGAQATLLGSEAAVVNAREMLSRTQTLYGEGLVPEKDVETARLALRTAEASAAAQRETVAGQRQTVAGQQAAVAAAEAGLRQNEVKRLDIMVARQQLRNSEGALTTVQAQRALYTLRAPLAGQVSAVGATPGETVDTATKIASIANLSRLQLLVALPSGDAPAVHPGSAVSFTVRGLPGRVFRTTIESVAGRVDTASGTVPALARVPNFSRLLKDDATVRAEIITERRLNVLSVPRAAVLSDPDTGKASVVVIDGGAAHIVSVTTGLSAGGSVEIRSGLAAGQSVAVSGQYSLPDGAKVQVQNKQ